MFPFNLGRLGNGITWWLGISPYELFFYIFLPPLLCDSAVRIDFFLFKQVQPKLLRTHWMLAHAVSYVPTGCGISTVQVAAPVIILAFLVVAGSCALMIPVMLYVFQLHSKGWTWQYAALFGSMLASTDAVAIIATMKSSKLLPALLSRQPKSLYFATSSHCSGRSG